MSGDARMEALREASNPMFNERPLKLGTFCANLSGGAAITTIDGALRADWPSTSAVAAAADAMQFEAQLPVARWRGFGGPSEFNEHNFETYTWAAGISASTSYSCIVSTSHVPTVHPIFAAKQGATIDHIGGGRWALNVVVGWHRYEIEMFGMQQREHTDRYRAADEWITIIKRLWTEEGEFDFSGEYYSVAHARISPRPVQKPYPVIINAAGSDTGRNFAAKHADAVFVVLDSREPDGMREQVRRYRDFARAEYGRELQVWLNAYVVVEDTEKQARDFLEYYVEEKGDRVAAENLIAGLGLDARSLPADRYRALIRQFIAGWGGYELVGTPEQVVDGLRLLHDCGFDGVMLSWARYVEEIQRFQAQTYPLLEQAGLR